MLLSTPWTSRVCTRSAAPSGSTRTRSSQISESAHDVSQFRELFVSPLRPRISFFGNLRVVGKLAHDEEPLGSQNDFLDLWDFVPRIHRAAPFWARPMSTLHSSDGE